MKTYSCQQSDELKLLFNTVIKEGYCIGCGVCAYKNPAISIEMNEVGCYQAIIDKNKIYLDSDKYNILNICPFSGKSTDEKLIGEESFSNTAKFDSNIGYYISTYAGYVQEGSFRELGSSGGMGSWIVYKLFQDNLVDAVVHVKRNDAGIRPMFSYSISNSIDEIKNGAKSRYYPVELSSVLKYISQNSARYAFVGLPCMVKALRLLSKEDKIIASRVKFLIGLVCGHLKSAMFADMFAWQLGFLPRQYNYIDFRVKLPGQESNEYGTRVKGKIDNIERNIVKPTGELFGADWGDGFFKYNACDYCDDVFSETADVSVGDAWTKRFIKDCGGNNIVIVRNSVIEEMIRRNMKAKQLNLEDIELDEVIASQSSGLRHKRKGLAYRLYLKDKKKKWRPRKRVSASNKNTNSFEKRKYKLRIEVTRKSHIFFKKALKKGDFGIFMEEMAPVLTKYRNAWREPFLVRLLMLPIKVFKILNVYNRR